MKKIFIFLNIFLITINTLLYAQSNGSVGINTSNPDASAVLDIVSNPVGTDTNKGVLIPRMTTTQRNAIINPAFGLTIFNTTKPCLEINFGTPASPIWQCISSTNTLNFTGVINNGILTSGVTASGVTSVISYTGGNGQTYGAQSISSTGVTGLTATLSAGTLSNGAGSLTYTITGTPSASGIANFAISIAGKTYIFTVNVVAPLPALLNSLDCAGAVNNGTLTSGAAASGVSSVIAYTGGNGGTYTAQSTSSTGVTGLTATLSAGTLASGAGSLTYTITGTPSGSGTASFAISIGGQSCTLTRNVSLPVGTISTLDCAGATNNGTLTSGAAASGVSSVISYTGGNGGTYTAQSISSTGVTGLTATLSAGTLASGAGSLTYTITGTPSGAGTASFAISIGGQSCTLTRSVALPVGTISTLDCAGATNNGTLTSGAAASGVSSLISYTGGNGGTYTAQSISSTGVTGLTATLSAGTLASGAGSLTYTITGTPSGSGTASFAINIGGQSCTLTRSIATPVASVASLTCPGSTLIFVNGVPVSMNIVVNYTGGNGGSYPAFNTNLNGLTYSRPAGVLNVGSGSVTYTITGTPIYVNPTTSFNTLWTIDLGGFTCTIPTRFDPAIVSTLNCGPIITGNVTNLLPGEPVTATYNVSYTGGNGGAYPAHSQTSTLGFSYSRPAGNLAVGNGTLTYTLTGNAPSFSNTIPVSGILGDKSCNNSISIQIKPLGTVQFFDCGNAVTSGTLKVGVPANVTITVPYIGGDGGYYPAESINLGFDLTATRSLSTLANGNGTITYTITGTPSYDRIEFLNAVIQGVVCSVPINILP